MGEQTEQLRILAPAELSLRLDPSGHLEGTLGLPEPVTDARPRAAFPFTLPRSFIELRTGQGELIGFIRDLDEVDPGSREAIEKAIHLQHFVPRIERIVSIKGRHHLFTWRVLTDRGKVEFCTRGRRQNLEEVTGDEYLVTDTDNNRYRLAQIPALDARSLVQLRKVL